jgi:hypothetical protein
VVCRSKKEFVNGCGAERKKDNAFADVAIAGPDKSMCRELVFSGYQFLLGDICWGRTVVRTPLVRTLCYKNEQYAIGDSRTVGLCGRNVPMFLLIQVICSSSFRYSLQ